MSASVTPDDDIMDFTSEKKAPRFKIGTDVFTGVVEIPSARALEFSQLATSMSKSDDPTAQLASINKLIDIVLVPESAKLFNERMSSTQNPIGLTTFQKVLPWLFQQYTGTPTTPDSDSSSGPGSQESGRNSTASTSDEA